MLFLPPEDIAEWVLNKCALSKPSSSNNCAEQAYFVTDLIAASHQVSVTESKNSHPASLQGSIGDLMGSSQMLHQVSIEEADFGGNPIQHLTKAEGISYYRSETLYTVMKPCILYCYAALLIIHSSPSTVFVDCQSYQIVFS